MSYKTESLYNSQSTCSPRGFLNEVEIKKSESAKIMVTNETSPKNFMGNYTHLGRFLQINISVKVEESTEQWTPNNAYSLYAAIRVFK